MASKSERLAGAVIAIGAIQLLQPFLVDTYLPSTNAISIGLGVQVSVVQLSLSAVALGAGIGQLLAGPISDSVGRRRPLFYALALYSLASLLVAAAPSAPFFFGMRALQGLAGSAITVMSVAMLRDLYQGLALIRANSRVMAIGAISWFVGPAAGSLLLGFTNWRGVSLILAGAAALVFWYSWRNIPETKPIESRSAHAFRGMGHRFFQVLHDRSFIGFMVMQMAIGVALFGYLGMTPILFDNNYHLGSQVGFFVSINSFGAYLGVQVGSRLAQRIEPKWVVILGVLLALADGGYLMALAPTSPSVWLIEAGLFVWTFIFGLTITPIQALALQPHGEEAGTAAAVLGAVGSLATTAAGPYLTTLDAHSSGGIGGNLALMMVIAIIALAVLVRPWSLKPLR